LAKNQFSKDWQETFKALNIHGAQFLELGMNVGRGNLGWMYKQVYPHLALECTNSGTGWDQPREREEGKRMRRLVRAILSGKTAETSKTIASHGRDGSISGQGSLPSAGTDPAESPNVSPFASHLNSRTSLLNSRFRLSSTPTAASLIGNRSSSVPILCQQSVPPASLLITEPS
jgi:mitogen-activated protein kinase kinase kinase